MADPALVRQLAGIERQLAQNQLFLYKPYPKQAEFHRAGANPGIKERLLVAANQVGKTYSAAMEMAMHLTGMYPSWWEGARFTKPVIAWAASLTSQGTRDTVQRLLLGTPGNNGTGAIPKASIVEVKKATHGVSDSVEIITVRHEPTGGVSRITLKTYDQGRERWQGDTLNVLWLDEEAPIDIYIEGNTRLNATGGICLMTFTPLLGMSEVVRRFLIEKAPGTHVTHMTLWDSGHYTDAEREAIVAKYPVHERDARTKGIPILGSGRIFAMEDEVISEPQLQIPAHWPRIAGVDFGWDHHTAAAWAAWDRDNDCIHIYDVYKRKEAPVAVHAAAMRARGLWIPCAWPHDGLQHDKGSGVILADQYRSHGVNMMRERATHAPAPGQKEGDGGNGVEAGLMLMLDRFETGRLKVAKHLNDFFEEFRLYHRKDGKVVKEQDDVMSAVRYLCMMMRHAKVQRPEKAPTVRGWKAQDPGMGLLG